MENRGMKILLSPSFSILIHHKTKDDNTTPHFLKNKISIRSYLPTTNLAHLRPFFSPECSSKTSVAFSCVVWQKASSQTSSQAAPAATYPATTTTYPAAPQRAHALSL
mmetsp:Transcript_37745/g.55198  ORF Transcript_37745/g.55198 Transcript_37745/m.55198 type:complete len:108 (+) Transcript_37745:148-471(+)